MYMPTDYTLHTHVKHSLMTSFTNLTLPPKNDNAILFVIICHHNHYIFVKSSQLRSLFSKKMKTQTHFLKRE